jgi:hypothetical protein
MGLLHDLGFGHLLPRKVEAHCLDSDGPIMD